MRAPAGTSDGRSGGGVGGDDHHAMVTGRSAAVISVGSSLPSVGPSSATKARHTLGVLWRDGDTVRGLPEQPIMYSWVSGAGDSSWVAQTHDCATRP